MNEHAFPNLSTTLRYTVLEDETGVPCRKLSVACCVLISLRRSVAYSFDNNSSTGIFEKAGSATYQRESAKASRMASIIKCIFSVDNDSRDARSNPSRIFNAIKAVMPCPFGGHSYTRNPR